MYVVDPSVWGADQNPAESGHMDSRRFPNVRFRELTLSRQRHAERTASTLRLRGADAVYVAPAQEVGAMLITWDGEVLRRAAGTVSVTTSADGLANPPAIAP